ncbi:gag-pol polyprotein [Tanacetum coccineum]
MNLRKHGFIKGFSNCFSQGVTDLVSYEGWLDDDFKDNLFELITGVDEDLSNLAMCDLQTQSLHKPVSYKEAVCDPIWHGALAEELTALHHNHMWDLVSFLVDYEETFAPVAKMTIVETLISVVFSYQCNISQMDIKNAFLNGDLNEEVYMAPPPGVPRQLGEVSELSYQFSMNDMVLLRYFLGFEVASLHRDYLFTQSKYIANLFDRFRMTCNKLIVDILLDSRAKYTRIDLILVAFSCQCNISQIDVKNAFSNGDLNEEVYMTPPPNVPLQLGKVASLQRDYLLTQSKYIADLFDHSRNDPTDLISVAFSCQCNISQIDVKNAFLNGDLNEEVYMTPPLGVP